MIINHVLFTSLHVQPVMSVMLAKWFGIFPPVKEHFACMHTQLQFQMDMQSE